MTGRLISVEIDAASLERGSDDAERERAVAIADLLEENQFQPEGHPDGKYRLKLGLVDRRLIFAISSEHGASAARITLSLLPFRKLVSDYFLICDSYYAAVRTASPQRVEAIDMGRRALHDEASTVLRDQLAGKIAIDMETARRLFTLLCALHWKG